MMTLQEQREKQGNWLFKRRSFFPLIFVGVGLTLYVTLLLNGNISVHRWWVDFILLCVGFFGLGIRIFTVGFTPKGTSGRNTGEGQIAEQLNTSGIYSIMRHPLYVGNFFMWLAPMLMLESPGILFWLCVLYWYYYDKIIVAEEQFLARKFGEIYLDWESITPRFFPKFSLYEKANLPFSIKNVLKREYNSFFSLVFTMTMVRMTGIVITQKQLYLDMPWIIIISSSFLIFLSLKMMKKFTKVLEVEGR
jgi:protein-S-isoprenylcysteine O-methyltransferase Ste14